MKLKNISMIFAVTGTALLYFLSLLSKPAIIDINELPDYEGKKITTQGVVKEYYTTKYASQMITIFNNNSSAVVYIEGTTDVEFGDTIRVTGQVQKYREDWEVIVEDKKYFKIVEKWDNITFPIWQLAQNPGRYLGLNVRVTGYVDSVFDSYFYLSDLENKYSLIVFYDAFYGSSVYPGKKVIVSAKFLFDDKNLRYKLELCDESHGIFLDVLS